MRETSPYGSRLGTGAEAIDCVVKDVPLGQVFTVDEIAKEVRRRGLTEREAVYEHLISLEARGHVQRTANGWQRLD